MTRQPRSIPVWKLQESINELVGKLDPKDASAHAPKAADVTSLEGYVAALYNYALLQRPPATFGKPPRTIRGRAAAGATLWKFVETLDIVDGARKVIEFAGAQHVLKLGQRKDLDTHRVAFKALGAHDINIGPLAAYVGVDWTPREQPNPFEGHALEQVPVGAIVVTIRNRIAEPRVAVSSSYAGGTTWEIEAVDARGESRKFVYDTAYPEHSTVARIGDEQGDGLGDFYNPKRKLLRSATWNEDLSTICNERGADWTGKNVDAGAQSLPSELDGWALKYVLPACDGSLF